MKTISFQGARLTQGQRRQLEFRKNANQTFISPVLTGQVNKALLEVERRKEQGVKPEKIWLLDRQELGTFSIAEWMGF